MPPNPNVGVGSFELQPEDPITISRVIARLNQSLDDDLVVIADIGDSLFAATELVTHGRSEFLSPAYYTSMGFSIPATLGVEAAKPDSRTIVIVGDGAFQMTGMELSTIVRRKYCPIVIILDNKGFLHPGNFNDIHPWHYYKLPEVLGGGHGCEVRTEGEFDRALSDALADKSQLRIIQVHLPETDCSHALPRLAAKLSKSV